MSVFDVFTSVSGIYIFFFQEVSMRVPEICTDPHVNTLRLEIFLTYCSYILG